MNASILASESPADRAARHLAMFRELDEMSMELAEAAARRALRELDAQAARHVADPRTAPDCSEIGREALARLDDELACDTRSVADILAGICRDLGIPPVRRRA